MPALVATGPVILSLAVVVRLTSQGPSFFVQERVGRRRKTIRVVKLRTMVVGADERGAQVTSAGDARVTPFGRFLRKTKLDELPQLWNVVRGEMSLVGPRPEVPRYAALYLPDWEDVFSVRPGITDSASLVFRDEQALLAEAEDHELAYVEAVLPEKIPLALQGIAESSVVKDLGTLLRTAAVVFACRESIDHPALGRVREAIRELNRRSRAAARTEGTS